MSEQLTAIKEEVQKIGSEWETFKHAHERELKEIREKGFVTAETQELLDRIQRELDGADGRKEELERQREALDRIETALQRSARGKGEPSEEEDAYGDRLVEWMRKGGSRTEDALEAAAKEVQALTVGNDPAGGYFVKPERGAMIESAIFETSPMRQVAGQISISSDSYEFLDDYDEPGGGWAGETQTRSETDTAQIAERKIPVHELYALPKASQKILEDSAVNLETWHQGKVVAKFGRLENTAFVEGNGVTQPMGFLSVTLAEDTGSGVARGSIGFVETGVAGGFHADTPGNVLIDVQARLKADYAPGAVFLMNRATIGATRKMVDANDQYIWQPGLQEGQPARLLGAPVVSAEDMPTIADDAYPIAYGNFREGYLIVDRLGISLLRDPYTAKPYVLFYTRKRTGGDVVNYEAIKLVKMAD